MKTKFINFFSVCLLLITSVQPAWGTVTVREVDRMKLNWENLTVQFYGVATPEKTEDGAVSSFKTLEKKAWNEGLAYIQAAAKDLRMKDKSSEEFASSIGSKVARSTYSFDTEYYQDGSVQVKLASSLANLLAPADQNFSIKKSPDIGHLENSGVLLKVTGSINPTATYMIVDENGEVLFQASNVSAEAFNKHLLGRWFSKGTSTKTLTKHIGDKPLEIKGKAINNRQILVSKKVWDESIKAQMPLLVSSRIALIIGQ